MTQNALLTGIYTLTPTHCGTGQANEAVDLPIARERTTGLPILPATSLKGVARDALSDYKRDKERGEHAKRLDWLFGAEIRDDSTQGTEPDGESRSKAPQTGAGALVMGEGFLLAYPLRSLNRPLLYATSLLLVERLVRLCQAHGLPDPVGWDAATWNALEMDHTGLITADASMAGRDMVVEDRYFDGQHVRHNQAASDLGQVFAKLLPENEARTRARLACDLVILPDRMLVDLLLQAPPVMARTKLTSVKTTSEYNGDHGKENGNLWYEENLPPDCLFGCLVSARAGAKHATHGDPIAAFIEQNKRDDQAPRLQHIQIGGNETVGHGRCWWTMEAIQ